MKLPRYTSKDYTVLAILIVPVTGIINLIIFGGSYLADWKKFLFSTGVTAAVFCINFIICGWVAVEMKKRFPAEREISKRLALMIIIYILLSGLFFYTLFQGYAKFSFLKYTFNEPGFIWAYMGMSIINVFITLMMEGVSRFENWKQNLIETEQLKKSFRQSQLQGLKSQVNPHFLFNSLNTLSCLIQEDEKKAEKFLNEMTKVYRYMLRTDDEQLVTLDTELRFLDSYLYLLKSRFGDGVQMYIEVSDQDRQKLLPALSLQVLVENAFTRNTVSRFSPLHFQIGSSNGNKVMIKYNRQERASGETTGVEKELDNLNKKYILLNQEPLCFDDRESQCCCFLPLLIPKKEVVV